MVKLSLKRRTRTTDKCLNDPVDAPDVTGVRVGGDVDEGKDGGGTGVVEGSGLKSSKTY